MFQRIKAEFKTTRLNLEITAYIKEQADTSATVRYAEKQGKKIVDLADEN